MSRSQREEEDEGDECEYYEEEEEDDREEKSVLEQRVSNLNPKLNSDGLKAALDERALKLPPMTDDQFLKAFADFLTMKEFATKNGLPCPSPSERLAAEYARRKLEKLE